MENSDNVWDATLVGRDPERDVLRGFVAGLAAGPAALILEGEAGVGKTTLLAAGIADARSQSCVVLACRPAAPERRLAWAALGDLLDPVLDSALSTLPAPQKLAVETAVLGARSGAPPVAQLAVSRAVLRILRQLSEVAPILIAIDDVQWLDPASAAAVAFALRRLHEEPLGVLAAARLGSGPADPLGLEESGFAGDVSRLEIGPLGRDAIDEVVGLRLGTRLPARSLGRLHAAAAGNPLFAIEMARAAVEQGLELERMESIPVPKRLRGLVHHRLRRLSEHDRALLLPVAIAADPTIEVFEQAVGPDFGAALARAVGLGTAVVEDGRVRFAHPLIASVLHADADGERRRAAHRALAGVVSDPEQRAWHMALAAPGPDAEAAGALDVAADLAARRGAPAEAARMAERARALTPEPSSGEWVRRTGAAASYEWLAGRSDRAVELLEKALATEPSRPVRANLLCRLGMAHFYGGQPRQAVAVLTSAIELSDDAPDVAAMAHQALSFLHLTMGDLDAALESGRRGLELADAAGSPVLAAGGVRGLGLVLNALRRPVPDLLLRRAGELEASGETPTTDLRPGAMLAQRLIYEGDLDGAASGFRAMYDRATDRGEQRSLPWATYMLSQIALRAGDWDRASDLLAEGLEVARETRQDAVLCVLLGYRGWLDGARGRLDEGREAASEGFDLATRNGHLLFALAGRHALGFIALSGGDAAAARRYLDPAARLLATSGADPELFPFVPNLIEACIQTGGLEEASRLAAVLEERGNSSCRPWTLAAAAHCRGMVQTARGDLDGALRSLDRAVAGFTRLGQPFDLARSLLARGCAQRRGGRRVAARASLDAATDILAQLGAPQWLERVHRELARIGGRRSSRGLTPTEQQVVDLAAAGRMNRQIAVQLFLSEKTVEANLSRAYRKLGVRSRRELTASGMAPQT